MEETIRALSVPIIVSIVYGCINLYKQLTCGEEKYMRLIPIIAAVIGVVIGIFAYYAFPSVLTAENIWQAIITGGASGLTATGANQIFKQMKNKKGNGNDNGVKKNKNN
ncbi:MAG: phage holin family protein [Clostridia bacterium]|nr:phage holin family protein [Clostridia bacterium]